MEKFIQSLTAAERAEIGETITSELASGETPEEAVERGFAKLLFDNIVRPEHDMDDMQDEGFAEYACQVAKGIIRGDWDSMEEIQNEVNELVKKYEEEIG
jgi:hypothetical protein